MRATAFIVMLTIAPWAWSETQPEPVSVITTAFADTQRLQPLNRPKTTPARKTDDSVGAAAPMNGSAPMKTAVLSARLKRSGLNVRP